MWPLLLSLLAGTVLSLTLCGQDRKQTNVKASAGKSSRSGKTKKAGVSGSMKTQSKSLKKSGKSGKSSKTGKSSKSIKSGKVRVAEMTEKVNKRRSARNSAKEKSLSASISKDGSTKSAKLKKKSDSSRSLKRQKSIDSSAKTVAVVELRADPPEITLLRAGGLQKFKFINESSARRAFKVKCSDNQRTLNFLWLRVLSTVSENGHGHPGHWPLRWPAGRFTVLKF